MTLVIYNPRRKMSGSGNLEIERQRAELKEVLSSPLFSRAPALSRILAYVCEKYFQGQTDSIKEYTIAVEALGRPPDFKSSSDTIVRVVASRLRRRLRKYYETEGAGHEIQIQLPDSGYVPQFIYVGQARKGEEKAQPLPEASPAPHSGAWWARSSCIGVGALLTAGLALSLLAVGRILHPPETSTSAGSVKVQVAQPPEGEAIRIRAGFDGPKYIDSLGRTWQQDQYYSGGTAVVRKFRRVYRTRSQEFYRTARSGDFRYDIPLKPGKYQLHLHFVEPVSEETDIDSGGEQTSRFHVYINDKLALRAFDIVADAAGPNIADERVFTGVTPAADGHLHLRFVSFMNKAHLTAIEVLPGGDKMHPVRIVASVESVFDHKGNLWGSDRYSLGGKVTRRGTPVGNTADPSLYGSERWGHFTYAIPAAPGRYRVTLKFAETYPAQFRVGERVFDVYCNGVALLRNFDVFAEAGGANRACDKVFEGLQPNAQGKLVLSFVPVVNYAIVNAIEVAPEG